jgi:hypothetical protein
VDASDKAGRHHQAHLDGERPRLVAVERTALEQLGYRPRGRAGAGRAEAFDLCRDFLQGARQAAGKHGDPAAAYGAIAAVEAWLATLGPAGPTGRLSRGAIRARRSSQFFVMASS